MMEHVENMKTPPLYGLWDLEKFRIFLPYIGSGTKKYSEFYPYIGSGPLYSLWNLEEELEERSEVRVVVYSFLPI